MIALVAAAVVSIAGQEDSAAEQGASVAVAGMYN